MLLLYMLSIDNLFVMDPHIMELQRLVDLGKQMNLAGNELLEFVLTKQALARDERIRICQERKEARIAEEVERARQHKEEGEERIAVKAEKERIAATEEAEEIRQRKKEIRQRKKEDETRSAEKAARINRHEEEDEEEKVRVRRHEEDMCHLQLEADNIRTRRMLQEVWKDAEERRREEEDEGECSISVTDRELWRKCFREQEALALEEAEEIRQHKEYRFQRTYEKLQWEKEDVAKKAEKTAELQQVMVIKTAEEEVIQHEDVVKIAELQHVKVMMTTVEEARQHEDVVKAAEIQHVTIMKTADKVMQHEEAEKTTEDEKMQLEKVKKTTTEDALQLDMVNPDSGVSYEAEDEGDASEQEASLHPTDDDDEDGRMSEERERNDIGQVRGPSLPAPLVWRTSKMTEDRPRLSSRRDQSTKRSSLERDRRMDGRRPPPLSKKSRYSSWARKIGKSRQVKKMMTMDFCLFSHPNLHFCR